MRNPKINPHPGDRLAKILTNRAGQPAANSLSLDLLKRLLAVPTYSRQEGQMVEFLVEHARHHRSRETAGASKVSIPA
jgi:hypothetical protein